MISAMQAIQKEYFWFHSPSWLDIQGELQPGESQSSTAQEDDRKGGKPSETMLTEGTATQEMMRKKVEVNEEEPKSKPHKQVPCPSHNHFRFMDFHDEVNQAITPTVGQIFKETVEKFPMHPALKYKEDETWKTITYTEYYNLCIKAAKSFLKVRVGAPYSGILIWQGKHSQKITQNMFVLTYKYVHVTVLAYVYLAAFAY